MSSMNDKLPQSAAILLSVAVLLNLVLMCMPYYGMTDEYAEGLEYWATVISYLFIIEMILKLLGLGCAGYWSDGWNQLDGSIVT